jgi:flagellar biosynthesis chaperone FliJ
LSTPTENVVVAARQVKATATLRDSEHAKYTLNAARAEQNALDELNSINFARKMKQL